MTKLLPERDAEPLDPLEHDTKRNGTILLGLHNPSSAARPDLISAEMVCYHLGISRTTLFRLRKFDPYFPDEIRLGPRTIRFSEMAVRKWWQARSGAATSPSGIAHRIPGNSRAS